VSSTTPANHRLHVALIPDGNRRWAKNHKLRPWEGHRKATENLRAIFDWCRKDPRISVLTVWGFSTENWRRDPKIVKKLMKMLEEYLEKEREYIRRHSVRLVHSGRADRFPLSLKALLRDMAEESKESSGLCLHLALDYGGKDELLRAMRKIPDTASVTDETFRQCLDHPELPDIDCIIRTAGEMRTSNFFLWQSTYAEWIFSGKLFPDFTAGDFQKAFEEFLGRKRHFGA